VWFTCSQKGLSRSLEATTLNGIQRTVLRVPGSLVLGGIAPDGAVLLSHDIARRGVTAMARTDTRERDLSWLDWTQPVALSPDGTTLLFTEEGEGGGPGYGVYIRKLDGSPAVRLGTGEAMDLSPDARWVIAQKLDPPPAQLVLLPTGVGDVRTLTNDALTHDDARFLPDGKRFVFLGAEPGKAARVWVQDLTGGPPRPITPEGVTGILPTPDGTRVMARDKGIRMLYPLDGKGQPAPLKFIDNQREGVVAFVSNDAVLVAIRQPNTESVDIVRLDLTTGARTPVRTILPVPESVGTVRVGAILMTPDGATYVQGYGVTQSDLYLVRGLR
jgi:dipeptidyl aminopeptidase/acylaminoacyl peptidase